MKIKFSRHDLLEHLLEYRGCQSDMLKQLSTFSWDCETPLVTLFPKHIVAILTLYLNAELNAVDVSKIRTFCYAIDN